jgi:hypothetical protein
MNNLTDLLTKLRKYRWCHNHTSKYYSNRNKLFTIPPIIFSTASSFVILEQHETPTTHYLSAILSMLSAMLSGVCLHLGFNAKAECHLMSANNYDELITKIDIYITFKQGKEGSDSETKLIEELEERILKIKGCNKFQIPQWVFEKHHIYKQNEITNDNNIIVSYI